MANKRTIDEKIAGTAEIIIINGVDYSPKRFTVFQAQQIVNEAREKAKKIATLQGKALSIGRLAKSVDFDNIDLGDNRQADMLEEALKLKADFDYETSDLGYNFNLLKKAYGIEDDVLEIMTEDEYEAAIDAIFEVNPSLKKMKSMILAKTQTLVNPTT